MRRAKSTQRTEARPPSSMQADCGGRSSRWVLAVIRARAGPRLPPGVSSLLWTPGDISIFRRQRVDAAAGVPLQVRVGIATGLLAVLDPIGEERRRSRRWSARRNWPDRQDPQ